MRAAGPPEPDAKTQLAEYAAAQQLPQPVYEVVELAGPHHDPTFTVRCSFDGATAVATAKASEGKRPKARAQMLAASEVLRLRVGD